MIEGLISNALRKLIRTGTLDVIFASGRAERFGDRSEPPIRLRFADPGAERALVLDPVLKLGELFMDGRIIVEEGTVYDLISLVKRNGLRRLKAPHVALLALWRMAIARISRSVNPVRAKRNVAHHYDLNAGLFELFLDPDRQYSCAYFETPDQGLDEAQLAKKRHIAAKLLLKPGLRVLDIGSGWGGLALYLAENAGVSVTGVTLAEEQIKIARQRAADAKLDDKVTFELKDYRHLDGPFDRIVSVGMFEHVGVRNFGAFFTKAASLLDRQDGVMLLHSIGRTKPTYLNQPFVEKYVFPGGYIPALSEVLPAVEQAGFLVKDIEILPLHYAWTLRAWRDRFMANRDKALALYDERFCRMWEFYLATSEAAFRHDRLFVFQMQLARHQDAVPYWRGYQAKAEESFRNVLGGKLP